MYSATAKQTYIKLYEDAQVKLASSYDVCLAEQPKSGEEEKSNETPSQR